MAPRHPTPTPVGEQPFRRDEVDVPAPRRKSRMVEVAYALCVASAVCSIFPWLSCATIEGGTSVETVLLSFGVGTILLVVAFGLERRARRRLLEHPELSGTYRLNQARRYRRFSAILIGTFGALIASCIVLLSQIDFTMGRPLRARRGRRGAARPRIVRERTTTTLDDLCATIVWARAAAQEHASIAAFEQLHAELARLEAPPELLARMRRAAEEEREHAARCFALCNRRDGVGVGPPRLSPSRRDPSPAQLAREQLVDGCLGEAYAARYAAEAGHAAAERFHGTLAVIARDESAHAEDAWVVIRWLIARHRSAVIPALREAAVRLPRRAPGFVPRWMRPFASAHMGVLPRARERELHRETRREVVARLQTLVAAVP